MKSWIKVTLVITHLRINLITPVESCRKHINSRVHIDSKFSPMAPVSDPNSSAVDINISDLVLFSYARHPYTRHASHQGVAEHASFFSVTYCPVLCSPATTVLFFPLRLTSQYCLLRISRLSCLALPLLSSHVVTTNALFPLSLGTVVSLYVPMSNSTTSHPTLSFLPSIYPNPPSCKPETFYWLRLWLQPWPRLRPKLLIPTASNSDSSLSIQPAMWWWQLSQDFF